MILVGVHSVFVPFEYRDGQWIKRDDLPRFLTSKESIAYLTKYNPVISWRRVQGQNRFVRLEWREHSEPDLIREYIDGVGTPEFNLKRRGR